MRFTRIPRRLRLRTLGGLFVAMGAAAGLLGLGALLAGPIAGSAGASGGSSAAKAAGPAGGATSWRIVLAPEGEPGEPLVVSGTVYGADGVTPAPGVALHVYQTDASGHYNREGRPVDGGRHARLEGTMLTGPDGRYEFRTIKPGAYPGARFAAHIHASVRSPEGRETWVDDYLFDDDPLVGESERARQAGKARFSAILVLTRGEDGVLRGARDIRMP